MGFQSADLLDFCRRVSSLPGVSSVWFYEFSDRHAAMWVGVEGLDETAWRVRRRVYAEILEFVRHHRPGMEESGFVFDRHVYVEHEALEDDPSIPEGARPIAA